MISINWKKSKKKISALILIILFTNFPNILFIDNVNSELCSSLITKSVNRFNELNDNNNKIDSQLLQIINSDNKQKNIPIIILYNYNDENFKEELERNSENPAYHYKIIPATSIYSSEKDIYSIIKSPAVKKVILDKKVYPLSSEKIRLPQESHKSLYQKSHYVPLVNQSVTQIGAPYLWNLNLNGSGVVVALLDTGIDKTHPDLDDLDDNPTTNDPKVINETSFIDLDYNGIPDENSEDRVGHGTHVAGIISGTGVASSYRFKGVAPGTKLMNVKVLTTYGGFDSWIIKGIEYACFGPDGQGNTGDEADIISMSLGGSGFIDDPLIQAVDAAWDLNKTVVIAAGNSGDDFFTLDSPGLSAKAITVGAVNSFDQVVDFSSRGPSPDLKMGVDICAPGVDIISALANQSIRQQINQNYTSNSGTSMATPFVSGSVALLLQSNPDLMPTTIKTALMASAVDLGVSSYIQGSGRLDVYAAYNFLNGKSGTTKTMMRLNTMESIDIDTTKGIYSRIQSGFNFDFFGDWHKNGSKGAAYNDIREIFFAIRYNIYEEQRYYTSSELNYYYPYELRWIIYNNTHKIGIESLKTPDEILKIDILYEYYNESKWMRISFNITSICSQDIKNIKFYLYLQPNIGYDDYHDGKYILDDDTLVANNTFYASYLEQTINNFIGFSSINKSIAFDIDLYDNIYDKLDNDELTNNTVYHGELALAQEWLNTTINPNSHAFIPIILAFGENESSLIENINVGKSTPNVKLTQPDLAINTLSISNPIYNGTLTYLNISVINVGYSKSASFNISTYIDNTKINHTEISGLNPDEEAIITFPIIFNNTGYYNITVIAQHLEEEFEEAIWNNQISRKVNVILPILATFFPHSPLDNPLNLNYGGQFIYWTCYILQGENLSELMLNKTGMAKSYVTFAENPSSINNLSIIEGIGQYFVNISIEIPIGVTGLFEFNLQLLNSSDILYEIPIEFEISEDLPAQLIIVNSTVDDAGLEDEDGVVEGEESGEARLCIKSVNASISTYLYEPFLIVSAKNDSSINILNYRILFEEYSLSPNETSWNEDDYSFVFDVAYNFSNLCVNFNSMIFAKLGYSSEEYIPFFHQVFNFSIQQRIPGTPKLEFDSYQYLDIDLSDFDGIVEPGEVGIFELNFRNIGDGSALQIFNTNFTCSDSRVTCPQPFYLWHIFIFNFIIPTVHIQWNGIDPGDTSKTYNSFPVFILSSSIPQGTILNFEIELEYCNIDGEEFKENLSFSYTVPLISGNGDDGDDKSEDQVDLMVVSVIIISCCVGGVVAVIVAKFIKKRKSNFLRNKI